MVKEFITTPISEKKNIDTVTKTEKSQVSNKTVDTSRSNKPDTFKSIDKSSYIQRTDTENKVDQSSYIPRTDLSNKITRIEKLSEINIHGDNLSAFVLSGHLKKYYQV